MLVTTKYDQIKRAHQKGFVIAQEMLQDPYIIDKRKTNCRVYLLVVCNNGNKSAYIYNDGFMYYTKKSFKKNSTNLDRIITTGYIDRVVYRENPLTLQDFSNYLHDHEDLPKNYIFKEIGNLLNKTMKAVDSNICTKSNVQNQTTFQLFGCDVAFNDNLKVQLIEINKGPDLGGKDTRDKMLKEGLVNSTFDLIGVTHSGTEKDLIKIY